MTKNEAIKALSVAKDIFVYVAISKTPDNADARKDIFLIEKEAAISAIENLEYPEHEPNIQVSADQTRVTIGLR